MLNFLIYILIDSFVAMFVISLSDFHLEAIDQLSSPKNLTIKGLLYILLFFPVLLFGIIVGTVVIGLSKLFEIISPKLDKISALCKNEKGMIIWQEYLNAQF